MEGHVTDVEQEVIITNNNLLFHLSGLSNDQLVLKQWQGVLNRIIIHSKYFPDSYWLKANV